jgi:hypothetical protein
MGTTGLARLEHQPGAPFIKLFISRCLEVGLPNFAVEGLSGLMSVSCSGASFDASPLRCAQLTANYSTGLG